MMPQTSRPHQIDRGRIFVFTLLAIESLLDNMKVIIMARYREPRYTGYMPTPIISFAISSCKTKGTLR